MRVAFLIAFILLSFGCAPEVVDGAEPLKRVKVIEVGKTSEGQLRRISGQVIAADTSRLSFGVGGTVARINVSPGDRFDAGQVLAQLDAEPLRIAAEQSRAQLTSARAKFREAEQNLNRMRELRTRGVASQADVDSAVAAFESAQGNVRSEAANVERNERDLGLVNLVAPFAGQVSERGAEAFEEVSASQAVLTVQSEGAFEVQVGIPETLIRYIDYGQTVAVSFPSGTADIPGVVNEIGARPEAGAAYPVSVQLSSAAEELRAGMTASVVFNIGLAEREGPVYLIPLSAIALDAVTPEAQAGSEAPVYVVSDGTLTIRKVRIGDVRDNELEVYAGLNAGDLVVSAGVPFLHEGMRVELWTGSLVDG